LNLKSENDLQFDDGLLDNVNDDIIPVVGVLQREIGESGRPIIGNQTILNDGTRWKVRDEIVADNFGHIPEQQAYWKWNANDVTIVHSFFDYWFHQIKFPQLDQWVESTNIGLRQRKYKSTNRGELIRYLGLRLTGVLERRRGGVDAMFASRFSNAFRSTSNAETVFEGGDYENRFGMSKNRFVELTTNLRFTDPQPNTVDKVSYMFVFLVVACRQPAFKLAFN
jgi:hypothetical protein